MELLMGVPLETLLALVQVILSLVWLDFQVAQSRTPDWKVLESEKFVEFV